MTDQPLPQCHRHPERECPGECQYLLSSDACLHDGQPVKRKRGRPRKSEQTPTHVVTPRGTKRRVIVQRTGNEVAAWMQNWR